MQNKTFLMTMAGWLMVPVFWMMMGGCIVEDEPEDVDSTATPVPMEGTVTPVPAGEPPAAGACAAEEVASPNHWVAYAPPDDLEGTGWRVGDTLPNFTLVDQYGEEVSLYQFYGMVIMIEVGAVWCTYCNETAEKSPALLDSYSDDCVMFLFLLTQDENGAPADEDDVMYWANTYSLTYPVLGDGDEEVSGELGTWAYPTFYFIDRNMVLSSKSLGEDYRDITRKINALL